MAGTAGKTARPVDETGVDDLLFGGGAPTIVFEKNEDETPRFCFIRGEIVGKEKVQRREYKSDGTIGDLAFWPDSTPENPRPKMQIVLTLADCEVSYDKRKTWAPLIDASIEDDDSTRRWFVSGRKAADSPLDALKAAMLKAKARSVEIGAMLEIEYFAGLGAASSPRRIRNVYTPAPADDAFDTEGV
jgi:hypothetical protein